MSSRLAFQTQLASIMEVLANAAVAEICKLVDDDYAVVSLQMSQCQRENKALKRKLHLLELKMARGNAERRLRESAMNSSSSSRPKVQISSSLQESSSNTDGVFERPVDVALWSGRAATRSSTSELVLSESLQRKSPGVELVEPETMVVKEEKMGTQEDGPLIGEDGVLELLPRGAAGQRPRLEHQNSQSTSNPPQVQNQNQTQSQNSITRLSSSSSSSSSSRGVEVSGSSPPLKCELSGSVEGRHSLQPAVNPHQYTDGGSVMLCDSDRSSNSLVEEFYDKPSGVEVEKRSPSCSYSMAAADFPSSSSSSVNGWTPYRPAYPLPQPFSAASKAPPRVSKERLFVCSYCGKTFNRPKKVEIHQRVHTGEKPFSCSTCGKMFSEAGNLRKHQRVHTGEKPYSCGMCGRGFAWIRNLKTHQQKSHPEVYTEEENIN